MSGDGGPAFPTPGYQVARSEAGESWTENVHPVEGMSLRDYFAAKAMQSLLVAHETELLKRSHEWDAGSISEGAYTIADAMISEREK